MQRTEQLIDKCILTTEQQLTLLCLKTDFLQLPGVFENFVETSTTEIGLNPL